MTCRICSGEFRKTFSRGEASYGVCGGCGAINSILTAEQYAALNPSYDPGITVDSADYVRKIFDISEKTRMLKDIEQRLGRPVRSLLDIGCGMGGYLLAARELGIEAVGVEPSAKHSEAGRKLFGLDIRSGYFDPAGFAGQRFDLVLMSHVIEHIYDPKDFLNQVAELSGHAIITITPNAGATIAKLCGTQWPMLKPIDHVSMLTPAAARLIAPGGFATTIRTSEYLWEAAATLISALRPRSPRGTLGAVGVMRQPRLKVAVAKFVLSVASIPVWLFNTATNRCACLITTYART